METPKHPPHAGTYFLRYANGDGIHPDDCGKTCECLASDGLRAFMFAGVIPLIWLMCRKAGRIVLGKMLHGKLPGVRQNSLVTDVLLPL